MIIIKFTIKSLGPKKSAAVQILLKIHLEILLRIFLERSQESELIVRPKVRTRQSGELLKLPKSLAFPKVPNRLPAVNGAKIALLKAPKARTGLHQVELVHSNKLRKV